jgi:hypothetical protein
MRGIRSIELARFDELIDGCAPPCPEEMFVDEVGMEAVGVRGMGQKIADDLGRLPADLGLAV